MAPWLSVGVGLSLSGALSAQATERSDLDALYGSEQLISLSTGYAKPIRDIPAVASIVTEEDIRRMGVRTLAQALERVPGVQVVAGSGRVRLLNIRGFFGDLGPDVLIKRNGVPLSQGSFTTFNPLDLLPINNIERIEIIRGPNSAVDGADALAGVINIVTKPSVGLRGTEVGGRAGNNATYDVWVNHGSTLGPIDVALGFSGWTTRGHQRTLETDVQSQLDVLSGRRTSLAPAPLNTENEGTDLELNLSTGPLRMRVGYYAVLHAGIGAGTAQVIDPEGDVATHFFNTDLVYNSAVTPHLDVSGLFSYIRKRDSLFEVFRPPGSVPGFAEGVFGSIENRSDLFRGEAAAVWSGWNKHKVRIAGGAYSRTVNEPKQRANARLVQLPSGGRLLIPLGGLRDFSGEDLAFPENTETILFGSLLDEWRLAPDWSLTTGLRFDGFSSVGVSVTPRVSLVWDATHKTTLKFLYGRGFRPPTYLERLTRPNQGLVVGNPDLSPQTIDTWEFQVTHWEDRYMLGANVFGYKMNDRIATTNRAGTGLTFSNTDEETGYGLELDASYALTNRLKLFGNYSFRQSLEPVTNSIGAGPEHLIFGEARWEFLPKWFFDMNVRAVLDRARRDTDPRPPIDDYAVVNLALQWEGMLDDIDLAFTMRNVFDADARDPSSDNGLNAVLPLADTPLAGREFWGAVQINF